MRQAEVLYNDVLAGKLTETDDGEYSFQYNEAYIQQYPTQFIVYKSKFQSKRIPLEITVNDN